MLHSPCDDGCTPSSFLGDPPEVGEAESGEQCCEQECPPYEPGRGFSHCTSKAATVVRRVRADSPEGGQSSGQNRPGCMALRRRHRSGVTFDHLGPARNVRTIRGTSQLPNPIVAEPYGPVHDHRHLTVISPNRRDHHSELTPHATAAKRILLRSPGTATRHLLCRQGRGNSGSLPTGWSTKEPTPRGGIQPESLPPPRGQEDGLIQ